MEEDIMNQTKFQGYNIIIQFLRTDKSFRITIDTGRDQWENIKDIPLLPDGIYNITIEPEVDEESREESKKYLL